MAHTSPGFLPEALTGESPKADKPKPMDFSSATSRSVRSGRSDVTT